MQGGSEQWRQYASALSILFVALFVGLPIWWKTTEVYRCPLPYKEIDQLSRKQVPPQLVIQIFVAYLAEDGEKQEVSLVSQLQQRLSHRTVSTSLVQLEVHFRVRPLKLGPEARQKLIRSHSAGDLSAEAASLIPPSSSSLGQYSILVVPPGGKGGRAGDGKETKAIVSQYRHAVVKAGTDIPSTVAMVAEVVSSVYGDTRLLEKTLKSTVGKQQDRVDIETMRQLRASLGYQISFTLINPDPSQVEASWNIEEATEDILLPFLSHTGIASLGNFTVNSQVFYYTDVKFRPRREGSGYRVLSSQLPPMISSVESKLASVVSQFPSLNFLIYVPKKTEFPLHIQDAGRKTPSLTSSFLVPQWGGVVMYNPPEMALGNETGHKEKQLPVAVSVRMEELMPVFIRQLKMLLGVPVKTPAVEMVSFVPGRHGITDWQTDQLLVSKLVESVSMATSSLVSLVQLLDKVKNMVISDHIQQEVESSLHSVQTCYRLAAEGNLEEAYRSAKRAMLSAETAFFDPSILELLYFPDDQKFAIYIPLFLPISIPILLSSVAAAKWVLSILRSRRTAETTKTKQE